MPGAIYPSGVFDHAVFNVPHLSDILGAPEAPPVPLTNPHFIPTDPCLPVIHQLFGQPIDLPPSDWLLA